MGIATLKGRGGDDSSADMSISSASSADQPSVNAEGGYREEHLDELVEDDVKCDEGFRVTITFQKVFLQVLLEAALRRWRLTPTRTGSCTEASLK